MLDKNIDKMIEMYGEINSFLQFLEKEKETIENKE